mmetsp:Transcript_115076/g.325994  ORF Transcript_115076/g.325994 Transcript_115076/m.325994 type:complete len:227 (-) Transcript_115076:93-773(-)
MEVGEDCLLDHVPRLVRRISLLLLQSLLGFLLQERRAEVLVPRSCLLCFRGFLDCERVFLGELLAQFAVLPELLEDIICLRLGRLRVGHRVPRVLDDRLDILQLDVLYGIINHRVRLGLAAPQDRERVDDHLRHVLRDLVDDGLRLSIVEERFNAVFGLGDDVLEAADERAMGAVGAVGADSVPAVAEWPARLGGHLEEDAGVEPAGAAVRPHPNGRDVLRPYGRR